MIPFRLPTKRALAKSIGFAVTIIISLLYASSAYAQISLDQTPNAGQMLVNLSASIPNLMRLVTAIGYVMGFFFVVKGVSELKHFGESRTMMSKEHELRVPLTYLAVGAALIYLPSAVNAGLTTFWSEPTPYAYVTSSLPWSEFTNACFMIIQLIGTISFIRGLVILTHVGGQQGGFGKALTHIVAGILCINLYQFLQAIFSTLGIGGLS